MFTKDRKADDTAEAAVAKAIDAQRTGTPPQVQQETPELKALRLRRARETEKQSKF
jgi:hypothetical protein